MTLGTYPGCASRSFRFLSRYGFETTKTPALIIIAPNQTPQTINVLRMRSRWAGSSFSSSCCRELIASFFYHVHVSIGGRGRHFRVIRDAQIAQSTCKFERQEGKKARRYPQTIEGQFTKSIEFGATCEYRTKMEAV